VGHKLLLADDSVTIQRVIELTFADEDIVVTAVGDGRQAIERVKADRPDIVLADIGMPERDGYEVAAFIKGTPELAHIPVLLLTGAFEPIDEDRARAAHCDGVLVKPFEPQMVINRVKDLIAGRRPATAPARGPVLSESEQPTPAAPSGSVEDYFDRLDAAFSAKEGASAIPRDSANYAPPDQASPGLPGLAAELASWEPEPAASPAPQTAAAALPGAQVAPAPAEEPAAPSERMTTASHTAPLPTLAEAFAALLSAEQGRPFASAATSGDALNEDVIEQVTRRVIERMTDSAVREVVLDVAERLVKEEIDRIRAQAR
jgi:CheY-like chemotaxis protein